MTTVRLRRKQNSAYGALSLLDAASSSAARPPGGRRDHGSPRHHRGMAFWDAWIILFDMDELSRKWFERAKYDLRTAEAMFAARRYLYVTFVCQQALEKLLKALIVEGGKIAPRTHNLPRLAQEAGVFPEMEQGDRDFLADLTAFAVEARYGDYRRSLSEIVNRRKAAHYLCKTQEVFKWLKRPLK